MKAVKLMAESPTPERIRAVLKKHGLTGAKAAKLMYLSGGNQVRKYTGGARPRKMDLSRWFVLHAKLILPPETIGEIERSMTDSEEL